MSESTFSDEGAGENSSYAADVDAGSAADDDSIGGVAGGADAAPDAAVETSQSADVDAGYDDPSDSPASGGEPGTGSY